MRIQILPKAVSDLKIGTTFYESQQAGLGSYFRESLLSDIHSLLLYAGIHERQLGLFRCMSKRFPFGIYYDTTPDSIQVYAVLDMRQDPKTIETRLRSQ